MASKRVWTCLILTVAFAAACPAGHEDAAAPAFPPQDRAKLIDAAVLAAMPVPKVIDDARLRALLEPSPDAAALQYLCDDLLFEKDDTRFISILMALVASKNPSIARMTADMVSGSYVVAASGGVDVGPAIDVALRSKSAATRRLVVRNLGLPECAAVRAWLHAHENDDEKDEIDPAHPTVASEARASLARLNAIAAAGESFVPADALCALECDVGKSENMPAPGAETTLQIAATDVRVGYRARSDASPPEPIVSARVALQMPNGIGIAVLPKTDAAVFSYGCTPMRGTYLLAWSRAISKTRVRFWFRCKTPESGK